MQSIDEESQVFEPFLTVDEIASILNVSRFTVSNLIKNGDLPAFKVRKLIRVKQADFTAYLEKHSKRKVI